MTDTQELETFIANLKKAVIDHQTITLGGGKFNHRDLGVILREIERLRGLGV